MKKLIKTIITLLLACLLIFIVLSLIYLSKTINSSVIDKSGKMTYQIFEVKEGESTVQIAERLKSKNLIKSDLIFALNAKMKSKSLMPGFYNLSDSMTMAEIFEKISSGETNIEKITIPEGYRTEQIGQLMNENKIVDYDAFIKAAKSHEGKLFPDTYFLHQEMSADEVVKLMTDNFEKRTEGMSVSNEDLILASIVEREAVKDEERPLIAGIYRNRINIHMRLEADPTVQYGKDDIETQNLSGDSLLQFKYWKPITTKDYQTVDSSFNTYKIAALPPAPICNPGIKSIEGAINYSHHDYLFFLQKDGEIYPSKTLEEHNQNRSKVLGARTSSR